MRRKPGRALPTLGSHLSPGWPAYLSWSLSQASPTKSWSTSLWGPEEGEDTDVHNQGRRIQKPLPHPQFQSQDLPEPKQHPPTHPPPPAPTPAKLFRLGWSLANQPGTHLGVCLSWSLAYTHLVCVALLRTVVTGISYTITISVLLI